MRIVDQIMDRATGALAGSKLGATGLKEVGEHISQLANQLEITEEDLQRSQSGSVKENLSLIEQFEDDQGWIDLNRYNRWDFTRDMVDKAMTRSRVMYLLNPLIHRAVVVQSLYVWGSGVEVKGEDETVAEVLEDFFDNPKNQRVIGESWAEREQDQRIDGNTFFAFFVNKVTGATRIRLIPATEVGEIECNPEDGKEPWYYVRGYPTPEANNMNAPTDTGTADDTQEAVAYPDIDYEPKVRARKTTQGVRIDWTVRVMHVKTGGLSDMRFGLPELYSALHWAVNYKTILESFAQVLAAYARMAMKITNLPGKKGVAATKKKMHTAVTSGSMSDTNPPNTTAGWALLSGNANVEPIKTSNSTTAPDQARALRSMVAAGTDTPEHFFGDSDIGSYATSSTLDRPTELKMIARQRMWMHVIDRICNKLKEWSTRAAKGKMRQAGFRLETSRDAFDGTEIVKITAPAKRSLHVSIEFPNILERDVTDRVRSLVMAATLGGSPAEGIFPDRKLLFKLLVEALGQKDAERLVEKYYPEPVTQGFIDPADRLKNETTTADAKADLGDAAIQSAQAAKIAANKPAPKPSGSPKPAVTN